MLWNSPFWDDNMRRANKVTVIWLLPWACMQAFFDDTPQAVGSGVLITSLLVGMLGMMLVWVAGWLNLLDEGHPELVFPWPCLLMCNTIIALVVALVIGNLLGTM